VSMLGKPGETVQEVKCSLVGVTAATTRVHIFSFTLTMALLTPTPRQ
jgi:hypothetical protein